MASDEESSFEQAMQEAELERQDRIFVSQPANRASAEQVMKRMINAKRRERDEFASSPVPRTSPIMDRADPLGPEDFAQSSSQLNLDDYIRYNDGEDEDKLVSVIEPQDSNPFSEFDSSFRYTAGDSVLEPLERLQLDPLGVGFAMADNEPLHFSGDEMNLDSDTEGPLMQEEEGPEADNDDEKTQENQGLGSKRTYSVPTATKGSRAYDMLGKLMNSSSQKDSEIFAVPPPRTPQSNNRATHFSPRSELPSSSSFTSGLATDLSRYSDVEYYGLLPTSDSMDQSDAIPEMFDTPKRARALESEDVTQPIVAPIIKKDYSVVPDKPCRTATSTSGKKFFFPYRVPDDSFRVKVHSGKALLGTDINILMRDIDNEPIREDAPLAEHQPIAAAGDKLWVHKYSPKLYIDLLGDEKINREVLTWIKRWDQCVFGRKSIPSAISNRSNQSASSKYDSNNKKEREDRLGRPDKRILLLSGRAGLGKTTLAHVVGKHSGYNVIEINASDDRTGDALKNKLISAIENRSFGDGGKPNMVVIDEIDGASMSGTGEQVLDYLHKNFMKLLVDLVTSEGKHDSNQSTIPTKKSKKKGKNKVKRVLRPIICICNDQYAPVLRPLRPVAQIYNFQPPSFTMLSHRLFEICKREGIKADMRSLIHLCEMTDGDIRSCLNTLQFLACSVGKDQALTLEVMEKALVGQKDMQKSLFSVWDQLFTWPSAHEKLRKRMGNDDVKTRFIDRLHTVLVSQGEYSKIMQGCFENYLKIRFVDHSAARGQSKLEDISSWIQFYDFMEARLDRMEWEFAAYIPYSLMVFYKSLAAVRKPNLEYPRSDYENNTKMKTNTGIVESLWKSLNAHTRLTWGTMSNLVQHGIPYILRIISPEIKGTNSHLLSKRDRELMQKAAVVMHSLGLCLVSDRSAHGTIEYRLEPSIDKVLEEISDTKQGNYLHGTGITKQMIMTETEKIASGTSGATSKAKPITSLGKENMEIDDRNMLMRSKIEKTAESKDFFGRVLEEKPLSATQIEKNSRPVVRFKYKEGFSEAVRRPLTFADLI